jgi:hypothetical protein
VFRRSRRSRRHCCSSARVRRGVQRQNGSPSPPSRRQVHPVSGPANKGLPSILSLSRLWAPTKRRACRSTLPIRRPATSLRAKIRSRGRHGSGRGSVAMGCHSGLNIPSSQPVKAGTPVRMEGAETRASSSLMEAQRTRIWAPPRNWTRPICNARGAISSCTHLSKTASLRLNCWPASSGPIRPPCIKTTLSNLASP